MVEARMQGETKACLRESAIKVELKKKFKADLESRSKDCG